jgi:hypothetical protein
MLFLRAKVIPVNPQIHGNVMCPLFLFNFIFEPLFGGTYMYKKKAIILKATDILAVQMLKFIGSLY